MRKLITHCKQGHALDSENTYIVSKSGQRCCRTCRTDYNRQRSNTPVLRDNPDVCRKAAEYLENPPARGLILNA